LLFSSLEATGGGAFAQLSERIKMVGD